MQMQTGPARGQSMRNWLAWTGVAELLNIVILSWAVWSVISRQGGSWPFTLLALALTNLILLQGGGYWLLKRQAQDGGSATWTRPEVVRAFYAANVVALAVLPVGLVVTLLVAPAVIRGADIAGGVLLYLFAVGEFVHYFLVKINMRPREWRRAFTQGRLPPARFRRELRRMQRRERPKTFGRRAAQGTWIRRTPAR